MTGGGSAGASGKSSGFLEFFILEASEYVERLDGLVLAAGANTPDADEAQRVARALRGTATMAKLPAFAELAAAVERVGRALHEGTLQWDQALRGALISAIDDLKTLLHAVRGWSATEDQRAQTRAAELTRYAPARGTGRTVTPQRAAATPSAYFANEAANIAAGMELLVTRPGEGDTAVNLLRRVQALRGVAGVKEIGPLADALEATEDVVSRLQPGGDPMSREGRDLLEASANYLRTISDALRVGGADLNAPGASRDAFGVAQETWATRTNARERVVPIEELFYADGAPGLLEASANPPTSSAERFRLELVSLSEHLRQVVDAARNATDEAATVRARRDLQRALRALQGAAESFGERDVADFISGHVDAAEHVDFLGLAALEDLSTVLAQPGTQGEHLNARLREISGGRDLASAIGAGFGRDDPTPAASSVAVPPPAPPAPAAPPPPEPAAPTPHRPSFAETPPRGALPVSRPSLTESLDRASAALIDTSIAALDALTSHPFAEPTPLPEDTVVPIETLLYRGRAALDRAMELRDVMRQSSTGPAGNPEALDELFDLLELARAE